ncbi:aminoacyl-tRNA hydrolase, partial [Kibdelosporangium lantanae]
ADRLGDGLDGLLQGLGVVGGRHEPAVVDPWLPDQPGLELHQCLLPGHELGARRLAGHRVVLAKPRSFMNVSGGPVAGLTRFYKVAPENLVVIYDELDIPFATVRLKLGGGENGHNGLRSITKSLGTKDYHRIRVGIGRPPGRMDPADFVLRDFSKVEMKELPFLLDKAADAVEALVSHGLEAAQNTFHALS